MNDTPTEFSTRLKALQLRLLDISEAQIEQLAERTMAPPSPPIAVARRQFANVMRLWMFCDSSRCRRSRCCRGAPRNCLRMGLTLLPPEALDHLLERNKGRAARVRQRKALISAAVPATSPPQ